MRIKNHYMNPEWGPSRLTVEQIEPTAHNLTEVAEGFQYIIAEAWTQQFEGQFKEDRILLTANPKNVSLVNAQASRINQNGRPLDGPFFVEAILSSTQANPEKETVKQVVGVGKAQTVPPQSSFEQWVTKPEERRHSPEADVSNVFVRPKFQARSIGSAILHSLLENFPRDMKTSVYELEDNKRTVELLKSLGFVARKSWLHPYFGEQLTQIWFRGPTVGKLRATLEDARPWLRQRVASI